jgi:hypothetical protein
LSLTTLFSIESTPTLLIPPALALCPLGSDTTARFPLTTLRRSARVEAARLKMPPLPTPLATVASAAVEPAVLFVMRVFVSVSTPPLSIPPPVLKPHGKGPQKGPGGPNDREVTVFAVMTLSSIVTVAPVPLNGGPDSCLTGMRTPPPNVTSSSGEESLTPPVIVTPRMVTLRCSGSGSRKIVSTGPPPAMTVECEPAPTSAMLLSIVTPPANVPCRT